MWEAKKSDDEFEYQIHSYNLYWTPHFIISVTGPGQEVSVDGNDHDASDHFSPPPTISV